MLTLSLSLRKKEKSAKNYSLLCIYGGKNSKSGGGKRKIAGKVKNGEKIRKRAGRLRKMAGKVRKMAGNTYKRN